MYFLAPAILGRAALLTAGALVPLVYVGTTAEVCRTFSTCDNLTEMCANPTWALL